MSVVYFLLSILGISLGSRWLENMSVDAEAGELVERKRAIQWGRHAGHWYFWIDLPSWTWERDWIHPTRCCWHQRVIYWTDDWGWRLTSRPTSLENSDA